MIRMFTMTRTLLAFLLAISAVTAAATPHVTVIEPSSGPTSGGTYVHLDGSDLTGFALACPSAECANYVQFGGVTGTIVASDDNEIVAVAPPHAAGTVDVVVNVAGKSKVTIAGGFRYADPDDSDYERILFPIVTSGAGAFGSLWHTDLTLHNATDATVFPSGPTCNPRILAPCFIFHIDPHQTVQATLFADTPANPGAILRIPRKVSSSIDIQARVEDLSRQALTFGTSIPIVHESDFRSVIRLHAVPTDVRFRDTLRVYGFTNTRGATVRIVDEATHTVIASTSLDLIQPLDKTSYPPFAQITSLRDTFPQIASYESVGLEVESDLVWAFVSVTNNETQHVTVIAPQ